ncbi:J domain-containing protein [Haloarcula onubensis]|uniref:J domain-containing protein n=1 Tax=Haloarcula onubensis TaxID=2950539 RepID=A0ABU2FT74_9EURY|nr:J domain-containing protein [Halomicroarcula sp. S3CR25-11]MDS0283451.1 J domain-containing protein [Halomicroarcula sp. S3CR25-11]
MQYDRLTKGIAVVFGVLTAVLTAVGILASPAVLFLALMFGASTYLMYYHLSGRMAASVYERVERRAATDGRGARRTDGRGGFGAGPREEWEPPRDGRARRTAERVRQARARRQQARGGRQQTRGRQRVQRSSGPTPAEAYDRLDLSPGADESAVKQAYRERVKEVHPDTDSGSEREFKRVQAAYETLTDD